MKKILMILLSLMMLTACGQAAEGEQEVSYENITPEQAKQIMDTRKGYILLDTRTPEEYTQGHIPGAIVISHDEITQKAEEMLPDKTQLILVYCRSGRRSKLAAQDLVKLGYTNVKEFSGIVDWPYETEK